MNLRNKTKIVQLTKAITWRLIASGTTFVLAMIFFADDPNATEKATGVALSESVLKILFYYIHERAWMKVNLSNTAKYELQERE